MARKRKKEQPERDGVKRGKGEARATYKQRMKALAARRKKRTEGTVVIDQPVESRKKHRDTAYGDGSARRRAFVIGLNQETGLPELELDRKFTKPSVPHVRKQRRRRDKAAKFARRRNRD